MSEESLNLLERDVEVARARLNRDLTRLRSPDAVTNLKDDLVAEARGTRDQAVSKTKSQVSDFTHHLIEDIKQRAMANPVAALAIGAGVAWRLARHPPITTILVGAGVVSLLRTPAGSPPSDFVTRSEEFATTVRDTVEEWAEAAKPTVDSVTDTVRQLSAQAGETVGQLTAAAQETAGQLTAKAQETVGQLSGMAQNATAQLTHASDVAADRGSDFADAAVNAVGRGSDFVVSASTTARAALNRGADTFQRTWNNEEERDAYLLGFAALAMAGAVGIACQRRMTAM